MPVALVGVSEVTLSVPLPNCWPATQAPVTVAPLVVCTVIESVPADTVVVPTAAGPAKAIARVRSALFEATLRTPLMLVARFTTPV